jgi:hypothetical protein
MLTLWEKKQNTSSTKNDVSNFGAVCAIGKQSLGAGPSAATLAPVWLA